MATRLTAVRREGLDDGGRSRKKTGWAGSACQPDIKEPRRRCRAPGAIPTGGGSARLLRAEISRVPARQTRQPGAMRWLRSGDMTPPSLPYCGRPLIWLGQRPGIARQVRHVVAVRRTSVPQGAIRTAGRRCHLTTCSRSRRCFGGQQPDGAVDAAPQPAPRRVFLTQGHMPRLRLTVCVQSLMHLPDRRGGPGESLLGPARFARFGGRRPHLRRGFGLPRRLRRAVAPANVHGAMSRGSGSLEGARQMRRRVGCGHLVPILHVRSSGNPCRHLTFTAGQTFGPPRDALVERLTGRAAAECSRSPGPEKSG